MTAELIIAIVTGVASVLCTIITVWAGSKLTAYRIEQLEKKVQAHNNVIERMYNLERRVEVDENKISVSEHRIADLERGVEHESY